MVVIEEKKDKLIGHVCNHFLINAYSCPVWKELKFMNIEMDLEKSCSHLVFLLKEKFNRKLIIVNVCNRVLIHG